jgi:hypothetical protein
MQACLPGDLQDSLFERMRQPGADSGAAEENDRLTDLKLAIALATMGILASTRGPELHS